MIDSEIINLYFARNEEAINETNKAYGKLLFYLANNILYDTSDADESVNDTYLSLWNLIPPNIPNSLKNYASRIVRNIAIKKLEYKLSEKRNKNLEINFSEVENYLFTDFDLSLEELTSVINNFLSKEKELARVIFVKKYFYFEKVSEIASELEISENKVKLSLFRTKKRLLKVLKEMGYE